VCVCVFHECGISEVVMLAMMGHMVVLGMALGMVTVSGY